MRDFDFEIDASGETCPMPLLRAKRQLNAMEVGQCLRLIATDKGSAKDIPAFISMTQHQLESESESDQLDQDTYIYYIIKR